jgi:membrane protein implicated in regulation of membrane protease activity
MPLTKNVRSISTYFAMTVCGLVSAFFVFYEIRLLFVTKGLTGVRVGGGGTYIGAVAFPILAILFGIAAWRLFKNARKQEVNAEKGK